jgi:hypothetical protein
MAPPPAPRKPIAVVTAEDVTKARDAIAELERVERIVTSALITLGVGGLVFTAVNVTLFAIRHHVHWTIAWLLDPLVSVSLLAVLFIDGALARHGFRPSGWPFVLRWFAGGATWLMNSWESLYPDAVFTGWPARPDAAGLVLHSVIPFLVIILAEAGARYRKFIATKKSTHDVTLSAWKEQQAAAAAEAKAKAEAEEAERRRVADEERRRTADLTAKAEEARIQEEQNRAAAEAEALRIRAAADAEARLEAERRKTTAEEEARRVADEERRESAAAAAAARALEARNLEARLAAESAAEARKTAAEEAELKARLERERIQAEAQAEAARILAEAEAARTLAETEARLRAEAEAAEAKRKAAEARKAASAETTALSGARPHPEARNVTALPTGRPAEVPEVRGAEAKRKQIEEAQFEAAVLMLLDDAPTRADFAAGYGRGETWGRERYAEAEERMNTDQEFAARVTAEAEARTTPEVAHSA